MDTSPHFLLESHMHTPSVVELLNAWERGLGQAPVQRAITLLSPACPKATPDALAQLSIGQRDSLLLDLRERLFGPQLTSLANCPGCGESLEMNFPVDSLRSPQPLLNDGETHNVEINGYRVTFRAPNSLDLAAAAGTGDLSHARQALLERCLVEVRHDGEVMEASAPLPEPVEERVEEGMLQLDPQALITLDMKCPACGQTWQPVFDILNFLWTEINAWAYRILEEVHTLARAYGWDEADILNMHPWRRQVYLDMLQG